MIENFSERQTLTIEHDPNSRHRQTLTLPPKNMLVQSAWTGPQPRLASSHLPSLASPVASLLYKEKKHQARRFGGSRM